MRRWEVILGCLGDVGLSKWFRWENNWVEIGLGVFVRGYEGWVGKRGDNNLGELDE